jgi:hypothetical protein
MSHIIHRKVSLLAALAALVAMLSLASVASAGTGGQIALTGTAAAPAAKGTMKVSLKAPQVDPEDGGCTNMNEAVIEFSGVQALADFNLYVNGVAVPEADTESDASGRGKILLGQGHGIDFAAGDVVSIRQINVLVKKPFTFEAATGDLLTGSVTAAMATPAGQTC